MSAELIAALTLLRLGVGGLLVAVGVLALFGGAIGALRLPDFYTRLHAVAAGDVVGGAILVLGLACVSPDADIAVRLLLLALLLAIAAPSLHYMTSNAAHISGLAPLAGKSTRQRTGAL